MELHACGIDGCDARISDGDRCPEHGGDPMYAEVTDEWGEVTVLTPNLTFETVDELIASLDIGGEG